MVSYEGPLRASEVPITYSRPNKMSIRPLYTAGDHAISSTPVLMFWWFPLHFTTGSVMHLYENESAVAADRKIQIDTNGMGKVWFNWIKNPLYLKACSIYVDGGGGISIVGIVPVDIAP